MEMTVTIDGYTISVSAAAGSVVLYIRDRGNCDAVEVAMTAHQAASLGHGVAACVEELSE